MTSRLYRNPIAATLPTSSATLWVVTTPAGDLQVEGADARDARARAEALASLFDEAVKYEGASYEVAYLRACGGAALAA